MTTGRLYDLSLAAAVLVLCATAALGQRHSGGTSPPTAPPLPAAKNTPVVPDTAVSSAMQLLQVNYGVPAPQSITRQLEAEDERTRAAALAAIGAPAQYLNRGRVPYPHTISLDYVPLGSTDEKDAILTVELDQHLISAVLLQQDGSWRRIATVLYAVPFTDSQTTAATFLRLARSLQQPDRYRAIYHAVAASPNGDYSENEAHLRVIGGRAIFNISFTSASRVCNGSAGCDITRRWLQSDPADPAHHYILIIGNGRLSAKDAKLPFSRSRTFESAHVRSFACQPFVYSDASQHYEASANPTPCLVTH